MTGVLGLGAVIAAALTDKWPNLLIGMAMVAAHYCITKRHIFDTYRDGQRSRERMDSDEDRTVIRFPVGGSGGRSGRLR